MDEPKYRSKGFIRRAVTLYNAARLATRLNAGEGGDSAIRPIEKIQAIRRVQAVTPRNLDDPDINTLA